MPADSRPRRLAQAALTVALLALTACVQNPNSVFHSRTEFNRDVSVLFKLILVMGTVVFIFTEALLLYAIWKFRAKPGAPRPEQTHGNTTLEILWTVIPAIVLAVIAVPTVQTIFKTQALSGKEAVQIQVIGHQWWWEFRYPQYGVTTANEVYMPLGKTIAFTLNTEDVIHSFWIPGLGGKRDAVYKTTSGWLKYRQNRIWFTADSTTEDVFNGFCAEYCGTSHANMRFKAMTVTQANFDAWVAHQQKPAVFGAPAPTPPPPAGRRAAATPPPAAAAPQGFIGWDRTMPAYTIPQTPIPSTIGFDTTLVGDATRGLATISSSACIACHTIKGNPSMSFGVIGPNLTHVGSRRTIGGGLFPNDTKHLGAWIKNSPAMKPGSKMTTMGKGQYDPTTKQTLSSGLTDQQIADIVAYLQALK
jgi:cytochrome c oxidase subunit 2